MSRRHRAYFQAACQSIHRIARAIEEGRVWFFEDLAALVNSDNDDRGRALVRNRLEALQSLIHRVVDMLAEIEMGTLEPRYPPTLDGIGWLMVERLGTGAGSMQGRASDWVERLPPGRGSCGEPTCYYGLHRYLMTAPGSHPDVLRREPFPTWWLHSICHLHGGEKLGLTPDTLIYVTRLNGQLLWDWEPRAARGEQALEHIPHHEWFYDRSHDEVFIRLDGRRYNLMSGGRLAEPERRRSRRRTRASGT